MDRLVLTDAQWAKMEPLCLGKPRDPGRSGKNNRLFVEAVLRIARTGSPWRDLPPSFGYWNSAFTRVRDWVEADVFMRLFDAVSEDPDMEYAMVDATIVKVHRHRRGAKRGFGPGHRPLRRTGKSKTCVWRWQERFMQQGYEGLLSDKTRPSRISALGPTSPTTSSHSARPSVLPRRPNGLRP